MSLFASASKAHRPRYSAKYFENTASMGSSVGGAAQMVTEAVRLSSLLAYEILDTLPEEAFDRITQLAAELFDVPIALVSLIDEERQWFKAKHGLEAESTPRSWAFCAHAIELESGSTFVVEDATGDDRFRENPLVLGDPSVRFYAGALLTAPDGSNLGTLCVIDRKPRARPSDKDLNRLKILAAIVVDELELRRAKREADDVGTRLAWAVEQAEAANLAKSTFLATMSHEIRTPLNGVLGMAQAMGMDDLSETQRERLNVIQGSGEALLVILNDVLDLSKIEAGNFQLESVEFDIEELAFAIRDVFSPAAEAKDCRFVMTVGLQAAGVYNGDPTRLRQILSNLVSNALKFTEVGDISMSIEGTPGGLELRVKDSGIGMSEEQVTGLFRKFEQADSTITRRFGGTGLGLAICREIATMMGGEIRAESQLGEGSTFTVTLPLVKVRDRIVTASKPTPQPELCQVSSAPPLRILTAEDNRVNQLVIEALLQHIAVKPTIVDDGMSAVEAWETQEWDLILMDVQMPCMDGLAATRAIREREQATGRARTPIIALTANAMPNQVSGYFDAGMDGFVAKPVQVTQLFEVIEAVLAAGPIIEQRSAKPSLCESIILHDRFTPE